MRKILVLTIALITATPDEGLAQKRHIPTDGTMVVSGGKCEIFIVEGVQSSCYNKMVYFHVNPTGRTVFNFLTPTEAAIGFSGGPDTQPTPEQYILTIDRILNSGQRTPADGKCTANISADGQFVHTIECFATTKAGPFRVKFVGDGKPVIMDPLPAMR